MKRLSIDRTAFGPNSTLSRIWSPDPELEPFWGLERAWSDNRKSVSCIPTGIYTLVPWSSSKFGSVYTFVGGTVSPFASTAAREYVHMHGANRWNQLLGCLVPGMSYAIRKSGDYTVGSSRIALGKFMAWADGQPVFCRVAHDVKLP